jgi:Thymidylate synthase
VLAFIGQRFSYVQEKVLDLLVDQAPSIPVGEWQSQDVSHRPEMVTRELMNVSMEFAIPPTMLELAEDTKANMPWAEDHFQERVSGMPLNPPPSEAWWPYAQAGNKEHKNDELFSHTYPERFWPKQAGLSADQRRTFLANKGVRYPLGDLGDVVAQLVENPLTRQAYLPVWFPEDTGAVHKERVPCTLGYHFLVRQGLVNVTYFIRSCDALRHFPDDVYMASRLAQWMRDELNDRAITQGRLGVGKLVMHVGSLHIFEGDLPMLEMKRNER